MEILKEMIRTKQDLPGMEKCDFFKVGACFMFPASVKLQTGEPSTPPKSKLSNLAWRMKEEERKIFELSDLHFIFSLSKLNSWNLFLDMHEEKHILKPVSRRGPFSVFLKCLWTSMISSYKNEEKIKSGKKLWKMIEQLCQKLRNTSEIVLQVSKAI